MKTLNQQYEALDHIGKRKMILEEAISLSLLNKVVLSKGNGYFDIIDPYDKIDRNQSLQNLLKEKEDVCNVCAMGQLMCSYISTNNEFSVDKLLYTSSCNYNLYLPFSEFELRTLELIFERKVTPFYFNDSSSSSSRFFGIELCNLIILHDILQDINKVYQLLIDNNTDFNVIVDLIYEHLVFNTEELESLQEIRNNFNESLNNYKNEYENE